MKRWTDEDLIGFVKNLAYYNIFNEEGLLALDQLKGAVARSKSLCDELEWTKKNLKQAEEEAKGFRELYNDNLLKIVVVQTENDKLKEQNEYLKKMVATLEFNARTDQGLD